MPVACVANLSIFRSMVDAWAIDQPFPILPLYPSEGKGEDGKGEGEGRGGERGEEKGEEGKGEEGKGLAGGPPDATLRLYDITCDSDGEIKEFVSAPHTQGPWEGGRGGAKGRGWGLPVRLSALRTRERGREKGRGEGRGGDGSCVSIRFAAFLTGSYQESMGAPTTF